MQRWHALLVPLALILVSCGSGSREAPTISAQVASFDVATGQDQRLLVGLFDEQRQVIAGGDATVRVGFLGSEQATGDIQVEMSEAVSATFVPVPGREPEESGNTATVLEGDGVGVYEAKVDLDRPGNWGVHVSLELDGHSVRATAAFPVADEHRVPAVGDSAPSTDTPTIRSGAVEPAALDSRARGGADIPDPQLHDASIAEVLDAGRPAVVVVSTPVYCVSRFCGPITNYIADLADEYSDRAEFVHLEVWADYEAQRLNPWTEEWIFDPATGGNEPWVFLIGEDGRIRARWDNVLDGEELITLLEGLATS